jgi:cob(I)alamin adenosyltransferase
MQISTKTGDSGKTSLYSGERVSKNHPRIELVGTLDELNCVLGLVLSATGNSTSASNPDSLSQTNELLTALPHLLFDLGAIVANVNFKDPLPQKEQSLIDHLLKKTEEEIEQLESELPPLTKFILPGGHPMAAQLHLARAICRRAERLAVQIPELPTGVLKCLNRLSDHLFLRARKVNLDKGSDEVFWEKLC